MKPVLVLATLLMGTLSVSAQDLESEHAKLVSVKADPAEVAPGGLFHVETRISVDPGWKIYSATGTQFVTGVDIEPKGIAVPEGRPVEPKPKHFKDEFVEYYYHEGDVTLRWSFRLASTVPPGELALQGRVVGQVCDPSLCAELSLPFNLTVKVSEAPKARLISVRADPATVKVGETFRIEARVAVDPGWHIYAINGSFASTTLLFDDEDLIERVGPGEEPKPKHHKDELLEFDYHEGEVLLKFPVRLKAKAGPGPLEIRAQVDGQVCKDVCYSMELPFALELTVQEGGTAAMPAPSPSLAASPSPSPGPSADQAEALKELEKRGLLGFILMAIGGGLVSLIMPCVYPLLPVTLTYFAKQGGESRSKAIAMVVAYALGIIVVFTGIGYAFSVVIGADGPRIFAANPWVNIGVGVLFFWFAFSLFGLYEITLPGWITGAAGQRRGGVSGAFILGSLFSVVTFTCTIPIAATVLGVAASEGAGNKFAGLIAMLAYSATMALPFVFLGLFPSALKSIPKSGGWMHTVKVTTAFAELALALMYFAKADQVWDLGFLTREVMIAVWVACLVFMALYLLGTFRMKGDEPAPHVGLPRVLTAVFFAVLAVIFGSGYSGRSLGGLEILLPVPNESRSTTAQGPVEHRKFLNLPDGLAEAQKTGKPLFVEFTGIT